MSALEITESVFRVDTVSMFRGIDLSVALKQFFLHFTGHNSIMCLWVAVTLIIGTATHSDYIDGQQIAIIVLYAHSPLVFHRLL